MNRIKIKIPIYNCTCHVLIGDEIEKTINNYVKKHKWPIENYIEHGKQVHGYVPDIDDIENYYIFYNKDSLTINIIAHEISHVVENIFNEKGIEANGEARSYLTGYITESIVDYVIKKDLFINKYLKKKELVIKNSENENQ